MGIYLAVNKFHHSKLFSASNAPFGQDSKSFSYSYSPIFPLTERDEEKVINELNNASSISFFFSRNSYNKLKQVRNEDSLFDKLFLSVGLAQVVGVDLLKVEEERLKELLEPNAFEKWDISESRQIGDVHCENYIDDSVNAYPRIIDYSELPYEFRFYLEEIEYCLENLCRLSNIYNKGEQQVYFDLCSFVNESIQKLLAKVDELLHSEQDPLFDSKIQNVYLASFVELSASLSYVLVQGYSGRSPILENSGPFPSQTLLGIGGFVSSCTKITREVEKAFYERPIFNIVLKHYGGSKEHICNPLVHYNPSSENQKWIETNLIADRYAIESIVDKRPLLTYVSLRHGFKESKFNVTSAAQSIVSSALPEWTLLTLTHEIMHSHVRGLLEALFTPPIGDEGKRISRQEFFLITLDDYVKWREVPEEMVSAAQLLRNVIFEFCTHNDIYLKAYTEKLRQEDEDYVEIDSSKQLDFDQFLELYKRHKRYITELIVHTLDFYYIYSSEQVPYLRSLWLSWSRIPAVYANIDGYIIRFLAALATKYSDPLKKAFDQAVSVARTEFEEMIQSGQGTAIIQHAYDRLSDPKIVSALLIRFSAAYYVTHNVRKFLTSKQIKSKLNLTRGGVVDLDANMVHQEFAERMKKLNTDVNSPVSFLLKQVACPVDGKLNDQYIHELSFWISFIINSQ